MKISALLHQHLPLSAWVSLLHRLTGVGLFLLVLPGVYLLQRSLSGPQGFEQVVAVLNQPWVKFILLLLIATLAHHVFAGLRHLAMDVHWGVERTVARRSAMAVLVASVVILVLAAAGLFA